MCEITDAPRTCTQTHALRNGYYILQFYNAQICSRCVDSSLNHKLLPCDKIRGNRLTMEHTNSNLTQSFLFVAVIYISRDGITKGAGLWLKEYILISQICLSFTGAAKRLETFYCNFLLHHCFSFLVIMIHCFLSRKRLLRVHFSHLVDHSTVLITIPTFWGTDFFFFLKVTLNIYI